MGEDRLRQFGEISISHIMIQDPLFVTPDEKISATELLMLRKKVGGLPVVKNKKVLQVVGIITQRDIRLARLALNLDSPNTTVKDLMTPEPYTVKKDEILLNILKLMFFRDLPIYKTITF